MVKIKNLSVRTKMMVFILGVTLLTYVVSMVFAFFSFKNNSFHQDITIFILIGVVGVVVLGGVIWFIGSYISSSIEKSNDLLKIIVQGDLDPSNKLGKESNDELGQISASINSLLEELIRKSNLSEAIRSGNLDTEYEVKSEKDVLGASLLKMRRQLKYAVDDVEEVLIAAVDKGELSSRIVKREGLGGAWEILGDSTNKLLESFYSPLMKLNVILKGMSTGDLSQRYDDGAKGDIRVMGNHLNQALENIDGLLHQITQSTTIVEESSSEMRTSSEEMSTNTREIASAISQMSHGAQSQVTKVDESSNLIEAILNSSNEMAEKAETITNAAKIGVESSEKGKDMVNKVMFNMGDISAFSEQTNESISVLTERSKEIARVLGVITDIASQTNLLALNAAIEAAQAGDAGRGFAVVAEEIRKLAEDSRKSAREIETLVTGVQTDTEDAAKVIKIMIDSVKSGEETSKEASSVFESILSSTTKTLNYSEEILNSAQAQTTGINDVVMIIESVVVIAEQTAAGTEEVASSSTELSAGMESYNDKAQKLAEVAESLKEGISMIKLSGTASENTAIFQMKEAYEKEKYLLDALLNHMPDTIYFKDTKSRFIRNSVSHAKQFGLEDPKELVGKSDFDFFGDHAQVAYDEEQEIMNTRVPLLNSVQENDLQNGVTIWGSTTKLPLMNLEGEVVGTFGMTRDVTTLKMSELRSVEQAEELIVKERAFQNEKVLLDALLDYMPDAIYFKDVNSKFIRASKSVAKYFGVNDPKEIIGKSDFDYDRDTAQIAYEGEQNIIKTGEPIIDQMSEEELEDGKYRYVSNTKLPLKDKDGNVIGTMGISRDITDHLSDKGKQSK
ncbi:MAG: methyl-accepting chemotaxis protein [Reichenbachiella sp.]